MILGYYIVFFSFVISVYVCNKLTLLNNNDILCCLPLCVSYHLLIFNQTDIIYCKNCDVFVPDIFHISVMALFSSSLL